MQKIFRSFLFFSFFTCLISCSQNKAFVTLQADPTWQALPITSPLPAQGWVRGTGKILHIYIEGDGAAYATRTSPSLDPTPTTSVSFLLASKDTAAAVAYLGRPCQYVSGAKCSNTYWTLGRFSAEVIYTMDVLMDEAMRAAGAKQAILFGYSGGGAVATLLAARRTDVTGLITICGNLDHALWTDIHKVTPLVDSLNPKDVARRLGNIPQVHFVGAEDTIVPAQIAQSFCHALAKKTKFQLQILPGLTHKGHGWITRWTALLQSASRTVPGIQNISPY